MECGLQWKEITCWDTVGRAAVTHEETMETAIPEYCPDLGRIVETAGQVQIRSRTADGKSVTVNGAVRLTVLYTSEESVGLRSLTLTVPFTCTAAEPRLAACQLQWVTGRLLLCEAQVLTARRLYVRVIPELTITGYRCSVLRLCAGTAEEDRTLRMRRQERTACLTVSVAERECSAALETPAPSDQPAPEDLLCSRLYPRITGCQPVGSKLMVKGELFLSALYRCREQQLYTYEAALPFSQIVDLPEGAGQGECTAAAQLAGCEVRLLRSEESSGFSVTAELRLLLTTTRSETLSCVTDLYSIRCDTRVETQEVTLPAVSRDAACALCGAPEVAFSGSGCDIRQVVSLRAPEEDRQTLPTVTEVELLTDRQPGRRPSLVMRRLAAGESLWDVAKQYHTDEDLIRTVNHLEEGIVPDKMLLIPRIR